MSTPADHLRIANRVRTVRTMTKRQIASSDSRYQASRRLARAFENPELAGTQVFTLLTAVPRVGVQRASYLLAYAGLSRRSRVGDLSPRQRAQLTYAIRERIPQRGAA